jgi:hypothetical protein
MGQDISGYSPTLITDSNYNMLWSFTDCDFDCWKSLFPSSWRGFLTLNNSLNTVSEEFANYVFEVREDVWECCVEVAGEFECGQGSRRAVCSGAEGEDCIVATIYDLAGVAFEKDFTDKFRAYARGMGGIGEVPRRVECFCQGEVLLRYDSTGDTLDTD